MLSYKESKNHSIAIDSTRSGSGGAKRFIKNLMDGLLEHTDLNIVLFLDDEQFDTYSSKKVKIIKIKYNKGYLIRILNTSLLIPLRSRLLGCSLIYSPWDIGPLIRILPSILGIHNPNSIIPNKYKAIKAHKIHELLSKLSSRKAIAVEFPSQSAAKEIGDHFRIENSKRHVIYHGAEITKWKKAISRIEKSKTENIMGDYFIFWSWFYPAKNITTLIEAFSEYIKTYDSSKDIKLICVGNFVYKKYKEEIYLLIESLNISKRVIFLENVNDDELTKLIYFSKTMIIPSLYETFGYMYVEGRLFNKPFIVADTNVAKEITEDQCIYFSGNNPKDLSSKMNEVSLDKDNFINYNISKDFYQESSSKNLGKFFNDCIDNTMK